MTFLRRIGKKKSTFTDEQILFVLKQNEHGTPIEEICHKVGISVSTFNNWKHKFSEPATSETTD